MSENLTKHMQSPWFAVSLAIAGIVIGYSFVIFQDKEVFAASQSCPVEVCQGNNCDKSPGCQHGLCNGDCPGNCGHKQS